MGVFYKVRVKISAPTLKTQWIDGLFVAPDILEDTAPAKAFIEKRTIDSLAASKIPEAQCDVVVFHRSNVGFILSPSKEDLENPK